MNKISPSQKNRFETVSKEVADEGKWEGILQKNFLVNLKIKNNDQIIKTILRTLIRNSLKQKNLQGGERSTGVGVK